MAQFHAVETIFRLAARRGAERNVADLVLSMNCRFSLRSAAATFTSCAPACAVTVMASASILRTLLKPSMSTIVPVDDAQGVSE